MKIRKTNSGRYAVTVGGGSTQNGTLKRVQKTFDTEREAKTWGYQEELRREQNTSGNFVPYMKILDLLDGFEASERGHTKKHVRQKLLDISYICRSLKLEFLSDITGGKLESFKEMDHKISVYSAEKKIKHFKNFCGYIERKGYYKFEGLDAIRYTGGRAVEKRALHQHEVKELLRVAKINSPDRYYPIIFTLVNSGLRRKELICLEWSDVDFVNRVIHVSPKPHIIIDGDPCLLKCKSSQRTISMNEKLVELLKGMPRASDFVFSSDRGGHLFHNFDRGFRKAIAGAELKHLESIGAHVLRHTFISHLLITGKQDIFTVAKIAGHASIQTTQIYLTLLGADEQKHKAVESLPSFED